MTGSYNNYDLSCEELCEVNVDEFGAISMNEPAQINIVKTDTRTITVKEESINEETGEVIPAETKEEEYIVIEGTIEITISGTHKQPTAIVTCNL